MHRRDGGRFLSAGQLAAMERPLPVPTALSRAFWEATKEHRLTIQRCSRCGRWEWTPQMVCSRCLTETLEWQTASGQGKIYSYAVVERPQSPAFRAPYVVAIVELAEGPRILTTVVTTEPGRVQVGTEVEVAFEDVGELALYQFRPA